MQYSPAKPPKLSVLICTIPDRSKFLASLVSQLVTSYYNWNKDFHSHYLRQHWSDKCVIAVLHEIIEFFTQGKESFIFCKNLSDIEIIVCCSPKGKPTIGEKRNMLLDMAAGEYVCFIDDDDKIEDCYITDLFAGIEKEVDCCSLEGIMTTDGHNPKRFTHSIAHKSYYEKDNIYYRYPNHLNCIRSAIAKKFFFPKVSFSEDTDWATQLHLSGVLKSEHVLTRPIYNYNFISNKK